VLFRSGPEKHTKELFRGLGGEWRLATDEKKRILLNNIYGVDIDPQAVEVTKLSLLLRVLEGETQESIRKQLQLFKARALPDLGTNIKCGNSLIASDFYQDQQKLFEDAERYRINAFDWQREFAAVFGGGGFDVIIGNPPYIRIQAMTEWAPDEVEFYKRRFVTASKGNYDIYVVFVERGLQLLNERGRLGFILPHKFFNAKYGEGLRSLIAQGSYLSDIVHFGDQQVFDQATTYTCLMFLEKKGRPEFKYVNAHDLKGWRVGDAQAEGTIRAETVSSGDWSFVVGTGAGLLERLKGLPTTLEQVTDRIFQGVKTSADKIYIVRLVQDAGDRIKVYSPQLDEECWLEPTIVHPLIKGGDSRRFLMQRSDLQILFPYAEGKLIAESALRKGTPLTWAYLAENRKYLEDRERGRMRKSGWYGYIYPKALEVMSLPKIFTPDIAARAAFSLDKTGDVFFTGGVAGGYGILVSPHVCREYILGLLNSRLLEWFIRQTATQMRGGYYSFESRFIKHLPIVLPEGGQLERLAFLVQQMLELRRKQTAARTANEQSVLDRQVESLDRQMDAVVYGIYGLSDADVAVVEAAIP